MANLYSTRNIIKIPSTVLSDSQPKWKLNVSLQELQSANQIIQLASSYITRMMDVVVEDGLHLENIEDGEKRLKTILGVIEKKEEKRKSIKEKIIKTVKKDSSSNTKKSVEKWSRDLFKETYIPHLCCIHIDKTSHYDRLNKGFTITLFDEENGEVISEVNFKRFLSTSASIKESEVFYVNEIYKEILEEYINCGRDMSVGFVPAKLSAYQALTMSSSNLVTNTYNVCVVDDIEHEITTSVMELDDSKQEEPIISRIDDYKMNLNCSDGFGFIDPTFAETWANDLQLYHTPSAFIVRNAFCKGVLARFPYKEFAKENNIDTIKDVWGKEWNIDEVDIVLTTSMLKLANSYPSWDDYFQKTQKYGYTFSVTKQTPKTLDMERTTNYQFIQSMDWDDEDIKGFLKPSIDEIKAIKGEDWRQSLVYLRGMNLTEDSNVVRNEFTTGMMIEPNLIKDPYVRSSINQMIKKRINDCKKGTIKVRGNYQTVICDPILLAQSMLGLEVKGILKEGEFHSEFWNRLGIDYVIQFRAPMVSANNIGCANLVTNEETKRWYRYLDTLFIFNGYDATCARLSGCDFDKPVTLSK